LGQTVNEYFCAFQFNSLGFQTAIANHAIATLSQQWRAEGSPLIILMPLYPKIVSDPATPKRCSLNDRVAVNGRREGGVRRGNQLFAQLAAA
jgi:hypothetical protein